VIDSSLLWYIIEVCLPGGKGIGFAERKVSNGSESVTQIV
jgi:hypothetical protein